MALLIEHYNGKWPFWLNPRQAMVLTVNNKEPVVEWARHARDVLLGVGPASPEAPTQAVSPTGLAVDYDDSDRSVGLKVREAVAKGYGMIVVVGPRDVANGTVGANASALAKPDASEEERQKLKAMSMTPEELRDWLLAKANAYE